MTTAIDYTNAAPHIGHSLQKVVADVLARWYRSLGYDVFYLTGTDEHGTKVFRAAQAAGKDTQEFVDELSKEFVDAWQKLNIKYDVFLRTSSQQHKKAVGAFIKKILKNGDIYKGIYEGLYCVGCEAFYTERDLLDGKICPTHKKEVELVKEDSYFFKLSKYQKKLLDFYDKNPEFIQPERRKHEIINRVKEGLKDLSISRETLSWGVPFPLDKKHVTYIWFEALQCYVSGLGFPTGKNFKKYWPADVQFLGKDNGWFHSVIWPAMLLSAGLKTPKTIYIHGYLTANGQKISKSLGNVIDPRYLVKQYGADSVRYFLLRELSLSEDGDFSEKALIVRHNTELADQLGNLLNRVLVLTEKYSKGKVPRGKVDAAIAKHALETVTSVGLDVERYEFHHALDHIWKLVAQLNAYVNEKKPWEIKNLKERDSVLYNLLEGLRYVGILCQPFIPDSAEKILKQIGAIGSIGAKAHKSIGASAPANIKSLRKFGALKPGAKTKRGEILFKKIEQIAAEKFVQQKNMIGGDSVKVGSVKQTMTIKRPAEVKTAIKTSSEISKPIAASQPEISYEEFSRLDLRIAEVKNAEDVKGSDKLLKLRIDVGGQTKEIIAGIKGVYAPDMLKGKQIVVVNNLAPREYKQFGVTSQAMLLAADDGKPVLLQPDKKVKVGAKIK